MILGVEIALTIMGLMTLIRGHGMGKNPVRHRQYRWLGAFMLTLIPVAFVAMFAAGVAILVVNPELPPERITAEYRWPLIGLEGGIVLVYVVI